MKMNLDNMAFQDNSGVSHQRDSGDESTTSSLGSPTGGLHLLLSAVQEVTSSSESDDTSYDLFDQTSLSTTSLTTSLSDHHFVPNMDREGTVSSRRSSKASIANVSRGKRAATRSQKQALLPELNDTPFLDLDIAPVGKREQTALSCVRCRTTHKKCDESRPCQRCIRIGCDSDCHDVAPRGARPKPKSSSNKQKQRSQLPERKSFVSNTSPDAGYVDNFAPFMGEHKLPSPPTGLPAISEWPRQLHYHPHPYPFYYPPSYLAPLPSSISSSSCGSSTEASSLSPPRLPLPHLNEESNRGMYTSDGYSLLCLPPPARPYYTMNAFNHDTPVFR